MEDFSRAAPDEPRQRRKRHQAFTNYLLKLRRCASKKRAEPSDMIRLREDRITDLHMREIQHRGLDSGHDFVCRRSYHSEIKDSIICGAIYTNPRRSRAFILALLKTRSEYGQIDISMERWVELSDGTFAAVAGSALLEGRLFFDPADASVVSLKICRVRLASEAAEDELPPTPSLASPSGCSADPPSANGAIALVTPT
jgi:hypothetical protein